MPRGSSILELDGKTDTFAAKEVSRGHARFRGDVPAAPLIGTPQDVGGCRMLIDRVDDDGGRILGSGCSVPCNVKPEDFRAMLEAGKNARG